MKLKSSIAVLAAGAIASSGAVCAIREVSADQTALPQKVQTTTSAKIKQAEADEQKAQFICSEGYDPRSKQRVPTTFAWAQRGKIAIVRWKYKWFENSKYKPQQRCEEVSSRFQTAYNNLSLQYLTNGTQNNQPVICTARQTGGACDTTLLTLRPEDDSLEILTQLSDVLKGRGGPPVEHSSGKKQVYYRIDIEKFLQTAPLEEQ